jgi:hypothetical protein
MPPRQKDRATQKSLAFGTTSNPVRHCETPACDDPRGVTVGRQTQRLNLVHARQRATLERRRVQCGANCDALCSEVWFERGPPVVHGICLAACTFANAGAASSAGRAAIFRRVTFWRSCRLWSLRGGVASSGGAKGLTPGSGAWLFPDCHFGSIARQASTARFSRHAGLERDHSRLRQRHHSGGRPPRHQPTG